VAVAETKTEVLKLITDAIEFHLDGLREDKKSIPKPYLMAKNHLWN
jgi:predicted RNase H-like HicB family nuclease